MEWSVGKYDIKMSIVDVEEWAGIKKAECRRPIRAQIDETCLPTRLRFTRFRGPARRGWPVPGLLVKLAVAEML